MGHLVLERKLLLAVVSAFPQHVGFDDGVQQLFLGLEMMEQPSRADAGFPRDLPQAGTPTAVLRHQPLGSGQDALSPILAFGEEGGVSSLIGHRTPLNQPTERTLDWFAAGDKRNS